MADISKLTLPNGESYDLKVYTDHVAPMMSKTFTGVIGTSNNFPNASYYFGKILPTNYDVMWKISYRYHSYTRDQVNARGYYEVTLTGTANTLVAYSVFNVQKNTQYRPIYNHLIYRALEPGIVGRYGHLLGWRIYSSWQPTTAASARTFDVDILECDNCEFTFFDAPIKYADAPGTGTTNYGAYTEINGTTNGMVKTGQDYGVATTTSNGLMSSTDKSMLLECYDALTALRTPSLLVDESGNMLSNETDDVLEFQLNFYDPRFDI